MVHGTEQLVKLIRRKHRVLGQLCEVGKRQLQLAEQGETSLLIKLLATKQSLISNLQDLERELAPFHEQDPESRMWPSPETRAQCAAQAAECNDLLREIVAMEQSGVEKMTSRRDAIAAQLQQLGTARQVCSAYESQRRRPQGNTLPGAIVGTTRQQ